MNASELMRGDWVNLFGTPCQVKDIVDDGVINYEKDCTPIPLTTEILDKNGFKKETHFIDWNDRTLYKVGYDMYIIMNFYEGDNFTLCKLYEDSDEGTMVIDIATVNYVHKLQHALDVCNAKQEIVL